VKLPRILSWWKETKDLPAESESHSRPRSPRVHLHHRLPVLRFHRHRDKESVDGTTVVVVSADRLVAVVVGCDELGFSPTVVVAVLVVVGSVVFSSSDRVWSVLREAVEAGEVDRKDLVSSLLNHGN
jgi:hypothetical protein